MRNVPCVRLPFEALDPRTGGTSQRSGIQATSPSSSSQDQASVEVILGSSGEPAKWTSVRQSSLRCPLRLAVRPEV